VPPELCAYTTPIAADNIDAETTIIHFFINAPVQVERHHTAIEASTAAARLHASAATLPLNRASRAEQHRSSATVVRLAINAYRKACAGRAEDARSTR
jgi:hypothetical protein